MYLDPRLWALTRGVRLRIAATLIVGLVTVGAGIARLALLGWLLSRVFARDPFRALVVPALWTLGAILLRGGLNTCAR